MNKQEIKYIVETILNDRTSDSSVKIPTPLLSARYITVTKFENRPTDLNYARYKFDMTNEVLECYRCREYSGEIPDTWEIGKNYDVIDGKTYKYLFDPATLEPYIDYFDFNAIVGISVKESE